MSFRNVFQIDTSLQNRRWQVPIIMPVAFALVLVIALAVQSVRSAQMHRRAVDNALRDYAAFATWQYTRRASDYLRLTVGAQLVFWRSFDGGPRGPATTIECRVDGLRATIKRNASSIPTAELNAALTTALRRADSSHISIGMIAVGHAAASRYLGYHFQWDSTAGWSSCATMEMTVGELVPVFQHVAGYAPLLPPSFVGNLPNDSLVSIQIFDARGPRIASIGAASAGMSAADTLGPDLAGIRVVATLHPAATERLVAGGMPASTTPALVAMLVVTLALCAVAVIQMRRTQDVISLRDDFVASVSHELKTPLAQISLFADTLASPRERSADERRQYLTIISREAKRLGHLVDGILHFAGMMRSSPSIQRESSLLGEEIRAAIAAFDPLATARAATIHARIDREIELPLDRDAFRQVMLNVLDNALKFGPEGQHITITVLARDDRAVIHVDDEGPGVPAAERARVFDAFTRADSGARKTGSGIGLAVVRDVIRRHGGSVRLTDAPSGGARVEIELPSSHAVEPDLAETLA